jgi:photosystem II stability/assembly factor-like uncharacterized protein
MSLQAAQRVRTALETLVRDARVVLSRLHSLHYPWSTAFAIIAALTAPAVLAVPSWVPQGIDEGTLAQRAGVHAIAVDPAWPDRVYVSVDHTVFVSLDGGANFAPLQRVPTLTHIHSLAVLRSSTAPRTSAPGVLVGTESGVYASADGGLTWSAGILDVPSPNPTVWNIRAVLGDAHAAYLATIQDLYRTDDGGLHWRLLPRPPTPFYGTLWPAPPDGKVVYLVPEGSSVASTDPSVRIQPARGLVVPTFPGDPAVVGADPASAASWFFVSVAGVFHSVDGGVTWTLAGPAPFQCCFESVTVVGETLFVLANGIALRSVDAGKTWTVLSLPSGDRRALVRDAATGTVYSGSMSIDQGIAPLSTSRDGGDTWRTDTHGLVGGAVFSLLMDPGRAVYANTMDRLHALLAPQSTWRDVDPFGSYPLVTVALQYAVSVIVAGPGQLRTSASEAYARSDDGGVSWQPGPPVTEANELLAAEPGNAMVLYGRYNLVGNSGRTITGSALRRSTDGGATWAHIEIPANAVVNHLIATGNAKLLAATRSAVWFSTNGGSTWTMRTDVTGDIVDVRARADRPATVYVVTTAGTFRTVDGGSTFTRTGDRPSTFATLLAVDFHTANGLYILEPSGRTFASGDAGATWSLVVEPPAYGPGFMDVTISPWSAGVLYAATGDGVRKLVARADVALAREFYHTGFDHYFLTASDDEAAALSSGTLPPWRPTGKTFSVWETSTANRSPTCRFFSASFAPKSSHFYTPYVDECAGLRAHDVWTYEGTAFDLQLPQGPPGAGACPAGTQPLYRAYNDYMGNAPNHRYTTSPAVLDRMVAAGWVMEGDATTRVFACVPVQD